MQVQPTDLPEASRKSAKLDPTKRYRVECLESRQKRSSPNEDLVTGILYRVFDGDTLKYDASVCSLHGRRMSRVKLEPDDLASQPAGFYKAQKRFPNDGFVYPACGSGFYEDMGWRCLGCVRDSKRWKESH